MFIHECMVCHRAVSEASLFVGESIISHGLCGIRKGESVFFLDDLDVPMSHCAYIFNRWLDEDCPVPLAEYLRCTV